MSNHPADALRAVVSPPWNEDSDPDDCTWRGRVFRLFGGSNQESLDSITVVCGEGGFLLESMSDEDLAAIMLAWARSARRQSDVHRRRLAMKLVGNDA